jgi:hypothetical protein
MRSPVEVDVESEMKNIRELYCMLLSCFLTVNYAHLQCVVNLVDMRSLKQSTRTFEFGSMVQRENEIGVDSYIFKIVWGFQTLHTAA